MAGKEAYDRHENKMESKASLNDSKLPMKLEQDQVISTVSNIEDQAGFPDSDPHSADLHENQFDGIKSDLSTSSAYLSERELLIQAQKSSELKMRTFNNEYIRLLRMTLHKPIGPNGEMWNTSHADTFLDLIVDQFNVNQGFERTYENVIQTPLEDGDLSNVEGEFVKIWRERIQKMNDNLRLATLEEELQKCQAALQRAQHVEINCVKKMRGINELKSKHNDLFVELGRLTNELAKVKVELEVAEMQSKGKLQEYEEFAEELLIQNNYLEDQVKSLMRDNLNLLASIKREALNQTREYGKNIVVKKLQQSYSKLAAKSEDSKCDHFVNNQKDQTLLKEKAPPINDLDFEIPSRISAFDMSTLTSNLECSLNESESNEINQSCVPETGCGKSRQKDVGKIRLNYDPNPVESISSPTSQNGTPSSQETSGENNLDEEESLVSRLAKHHSYGAHMRQAFEALEAFLTDDTRTSLNENELEDYAEFCESIDNELDEIQFEKEP